MEGQIKFHLNGEPVSVAVKPDTTVLDLLRNQLGKHGTKEGCAEGDCGACTVLLRRPGINGGKAKAANSCILTASQIQGAEITTVEGLSENGILSDLQKAMAENGSSQCGFCTPGIVVALSGLLQQHANPSETEIHDALAGNLCRCTGYRPIVEAAMKAARTVCNPNNNRSAETKQPATSGIGGHTALHPRSLEDLLTARQENPQAILLAGGTDLGIARAAYEKDWPTLILTHQVEELRVIEHTGDHWTFGAAVTWQEILDQLGDEIPSLSTLIRRFGSTQIRSMGTIGGNIGTASPIGDGAPALIALGTEITFADAGGKQSTMPLEDFFLDYRTTALPENGIIISVNVPKPKPDEHFRVYKVSKRYDQDISTVCGAFLLTLEGDKIVTGRAAYGGMAATPKRATALENMLAGKSVIDLQNGPAGKTVDEDFKPLTDWRGSANYRMQVAKALVQRLGHDLAGETVEVMAL